MKLQLISEYSALVFVSESCFSGRFVWSNVNKGKFFESISAEYLKAKKYEEWNRNVSHRRGECDWVGLDPEGVLVFAEVRAVLRKESPYGVFEYFSYEKQCRWKRSVEIYLSGLSRNQAGLSRVKGVRLDLIALRGLDLHGSFFRRLRASVLKNNAPDKNMRCFHLEHRTGVIDV